MDTLAARPRMCPAGLAVTALPTALFLAAALAEPAWTSDPTMHRIINTIWLVTVLLIPAFCLHALPQADDARRRYGLLFYTCAYVAYLAHVYFAVFIHFGGIQGTFDGMRTSIATSSFIITLWWTIDLVIAWSAPPAAKWVRVERFAAMTFLYVVFVVTELFLRPTAIKYLGFTMAVLVPLCLVARLKTCSPLSSGVSRLKVVPFCWNESESSDDFVTGKPEPGHPSPEHHQGGLAAAPHHASAHPPRDRDSGARDSVRQPLGQCRAAAD